MRYARQPTEGDGKLNQAGDHNQGAANYLSMEEET